MFELGDDLPSLAADPDRVALVQNRDLLNMIQLGRSATPLDLMSYRPEDEQPSVFLLHESARQSVLAVFNWTQHATTHQFSLHELGLAPGGSYELHDVLAALPAAAVRSGTIGVKDQAPRSVRLFKIVDRSVPASAPSVTARVPTSALVANPVALSAESMSEASPALAYQWQFDDGVSVEGASISHAFTTPGRHTIKLHVDGLEGVPYEGSYQVNVTGRVDTHFKPDQNQRYTAPGEALHH